MEFLVGGQCDLLALGAGSADYGDCHAAGGWLADLGAVPG